MKSFKKKALIVLLGLGFSLGVQWSMAMANGDVFLCLPSPEVCLYLDGQLINGANTPVIQHP